MTKLGRHAHLHGNNVASLHFLIEPFPPRKKTVAVILSHLFGSVFYIFSPLTLWRSFFHACFLSGIFNTSVLPRSQQQIELSFPLSTNGRAVVE